MRDLRAVLCNPLKLVTITNHKINRCKHQSRNNPFAREQRMCVKQITTAVQGYNVKSESGTVLSTAPPEATDQGRVLPVEVSVGRLGDLELEIKIATLRLV